MDGYRDPYRAPLSAGYYTFPRYGSSYALSADPLLSAYARASLDAYAGYAAHQPELLRLHRYGAPLHSLSPRRRSSPRRRPSAQNGRKWRPPPLQNLAPKKTPFKKTRKGLLVENSTPKKGFQQRKVAQKQQGDRKLAGKSLNSAATSLVKETQELHSLFRTGVDTSTGKKLVKPSAKKAGETLLKQSSLNGRGQKRKAGAQKKAEAAPPSAKKLKGKKKKKLAKKKQQEANKKDEKPVVSTPKGVNVELPVLTEEEVEALLALQNAACKAVGEFLGIADKKEEVEKSDVPDASVDDAKLAEAQPNSDEVKVVEAQPNSDDEVHAKLEDASKPAAAALTPDQEVELEEEGYKFFSKLLEENQDLRNLYLEKKDVGTFECLVCRSVDPETSKKFANLTNLVMHTSMRKQKRPEHRGYGRAICDVLGWESLRTPKRPAKQAKQEGDGVKQSEVEEVPEEGKPQES